MSTLDLFLSLAKVDLDQRIVQGVATAEVPDRVGEICDYASTKPYFETWSADALAASGGKSFGAVRAMHGRVAAGKLTDIAFDDEGKRILVAAKIVDDDEWRKVTEGVYTGFSQGGRYVKRWPDPDSGLTRYTAEPSEISLVDLPCLPGATFEVVKDGIVEKRAFAAARQEAQESRRRRSAAAEAAPAIAADPPRASAPSPSDALAKAASGALAGRAETRTGDRGELGAAQVARRPLARNRRPRQTPRRAGSPAAARQGRAARRAQERRFLRRARRRRRRSDQAPRRPARAGTRARAHQAQPRQPDPAALLNRERRHARRNAARGLDRAQSERARLSAAGIRERRAHARRWNEDRRAARRLA